MQRLDEGHPWYLKSVAACANISEKTLRAYHDVWKKLGQSDGANREEIFEYFVEHKKPGPQMADPVAMWRMSKRADWLIDEGQGQKCSTIRRVFKNVALPELQTVREHVTNSRKEKFISYMGGYNASAKEAKRQLKLRRGSLGGRGGS